jgi:hypothetical protein
MQRVLTQDLWKEVSARARKARGRKAAIAYVTKDLLHLGRGDVLITNASTACIAGGNTDAKLLRRLSRKGVDVYHCEDLHAKVVLLDLPHGPVAVIGSANMSGSSGGLVEAGLLTDNPSIASGVASLIEQLKERSELLVTKRLASLCAIKVVRRGRASGAKKVKKRRALEPLGNQMWIIGVRVLAKDPPPKELKKIEEAAEQLATDIDDLDWLRWDKKSRFARECRKGDLVIQLWRSSGSKRPSKVLKATPILLKQATQTWTRFYLGEPQGRSKEIPVSHFKALLKKIGYGREVGPNVAQLVEPDLADAIARSWPSAARER